MVVTVNHWHFVFRSVQGIVTKEGMLLKTSIISAAAGALLLLALLRLHGRASLDSSAELAGDHKALLDFTAEPVLTAAAAELAGITKLALAISDIACPS